MITYENVQHIGEFLYGIDRGDWSTTEDVDRNERIMSKRMFKSTKCGAWLKLVHNNGMVSGIEVGSIVEGADIEIGPMVLEFPFTSDEFGDVLDEIEMDAHNEWLSVNQDLDQAM